MATYTNNTGISLALAVWLAHDNYDYNEDPNVISATSLIKPIRQLVLTPRVPPTKAPTDVASRVHSSIGSAIHNSIEDTWLDHYRTAMADLGYPAAVITNIRINPTPEVLAKNPDIIPIYMEQRNHREIDIGGTKFIISGKADFIAEGHVEDFKSTGTYTYTKNTKEDDHRLQGSIYRWINPKVITADFMRIHFIFTDWKAYELKSQKNYPPAKLVTKKISLMSLPETESYIRNKLSQILTLKDAPEGDIPLCTPKELWMDDPVFKYYKDSSKAGIPGTRSTKNFTSKTEAYAHLSKLNGVGTVVPVPGKAKACHFCDAFLACSQKDQLVADGTLDL